MRGFAVASDKLIARKSREYATQKLEWLDFYLHAALSATTKKLDRVYVDLFAGPGRNVSATGEFEGSPIRALRARGPGVRAPSFTEAVFVNAALAQHDALSRRVAEVCKRGEGAVPQEKVRLIRGDANSAVPEIMASLPSQAYVFVFADIERPGHFPWNSVQALKARGHNSVDFYVLFPLEMGIRRLLPYSPGRVLGGEAKLTAFFGTDEWKPILAARKTGSQSTDFHRRMTDLYCRQLRTLWDGARPVLQVSLAGHHGLYRMLFASSHDAAERISAAIARKMKTRSQLEFL